MKIETDDWIPMSDVVDSTKIPQKTAYRIADRLGIVSVFFGVKCVRKSDVAKIVAGRLPVGNPEWIADGDAAGEAAERATKSRMRRIEQSGPTKREVKRNKKLAVIGRTLGGRPKKED